MVDRVIATETALELIAQLQQQYGALMFHQSGGCCDNSASQYEYWKLTQLIIDVIDGSTGKAFHSRSRLFTDAEWAELQARGLV